MTDQEFADVKARIEELRARWVEPLGLGNWTIAIECFRDSGEYQEAAVSGPESVASCDASWEYLDARICFNCSLFMELSESYQERAVIHELCHCLLAEVQMCMEYENKHHIEHTATSLAQAFQWVRNTPRD